MNDSTKQSLQDLITHLQEIGLALKGLGRTEPDFDHWSWRDSYNFITGNITGSVRNILNGISTNISRAEMLNRTITHDLSFLAERHLTQILAAIKSRPGIDKKLHRVLPDAAQGNDVSESTLRLCKDEWQHIKNVAREQASSLAGFIKQIEGETGRGDKPTPETDPSLMYQANAEDFYNLPKSTLSKAAQKKPGELGYLWSETEGRRRFYRKSDLEKLSRSRKRLRGA